MLNVCIMSVFLCSNKIRRKRVNLYSAFALHVALCPLQPVRVLLLADSLVDLRAQLLRPLQGLSQRAAVPVAVRGVLQDLKRNHAMNVW